MPRGLALLACRQPRVSPVEHATAWALPEGCSAALHGSSQLSLQLNIAPLASCHLKTALHAVMHITGAAHQ